MDQGIPGQKTWKIKSHNVDRHLPHDHRSYSMTPMLLTAYTHTVCICSVFDATPFSIAFKSERRGICESLWLVVYHVFMSIVYNRLNCIVVAVGSKQNERLAHATREWRVRENNRWSKWEPLKDLNDSKYFNSNEMNFKWMKIHFLVSQCVNEIIIPKKILHMFKQTKEKIGMFGVENRHRSISSVMLFASLIILKNEN